MVCIQYYVYSFDVSSKIWKIIFNILFFCGKWTNELAGRPIKTWTNNLTGSIAGSVFKLWEGGDQLLKKYAGECIRNNTYAMLAGATPCPNKLKFGANLTHKIIYHQRGRVM